MFILRILAVLPSLVFLLFFHLPLSAQEVPDMPEFDFETRHAWTAKVTIAPVLVLGESKRGLRRVIPITGGSFEGPNIHGEVVPGGEDWQLVRPDGVTELYARYLLRTHDGYLIQVINQVTSHTKDNGALYRRSVIDLEAPLDSPYDYLNESMFLGTLDVPESLEDGEEPYVVIGFYELL